MLTFDQFKAKVGSLSDLIKKAFDGGWGLIFLGNSLNHPNVFRLEFQDPLIWDLSFTIEIPADLYMIIEYCYNSERAIVETANNLRTSLAYKYRLKVEDGYLRSCKVLLAELESSKILRDKELDDSLTVLDDSYVIPEAYKNYVKTYDFLHPGGRE